MIRGSIALSYRLSLLQAQIIFHVQKAVKSFYSIEAMPVVPQAMDAFQQFKIAVPRFARPRATLRGIFEDRRLHQQQTYRFLLEYVAVRLLSIHKQWWWDEDIFTTIRDLPLEDATVEEMIEMTKSIQREHILRLFYVYRRVKACSDSFRGCT